MKIVIPSRNRATNLKTLQQIPSSHAEQTVVLVHENEYDDYAPVWANIETHTLENISEIREHIILSNTEPVFMIDDDTTFFTRTKENKFVKSTLEEMTELLDEIEFNFILGYDAVSVADRFMANTLPTKGNPGKLNFSVFGVDPTFWRDNSLTMPNITVAEDLYIGIAYGAHGAAMLQITDWVQTHDTFTPGGCDEYRKPEDTAHGLTVVQAMFPDYIKLLPKTYPDGTPMRRIAWKRMAANVKANRAHLVRST